MHHFDILRLSEALICDKLHKITIIFEYTKKSPAFLLKAGLLLFASMNAVQNRRISAVSILNAAVDAADGCSADFYIFYNLLVGTARCV